ncbi:MAG: PilZ domain-containing protein [Vicinamibacterales bacterium]
MLATASTLSMNSAQTAELGSYGTPETENRSARRRKALEVPTIQGLRLAPFGGQVTLVNISESGLLVETGLGLPPGREVTVSATGGTTLFSVRARVVRTVIARIAPEGIRYHIGLAFLQHVSLPEPLMAPEPAEQHAPLVAFPVIASGDPARMAEPSVVMNQW